MEYNIGTVVTLKKGHPCGTNEWEIIRTGADFKLKCKGCGRIVMVPRKTFEKRLDKQERTWYDLKVAAVLMKDGLTK